MMRAGRRAARRSIHELLYAHRSSTCSTMATRSSSRSTQIQPPPLSYDELHTMSKLRTLTARFRQPCSITRGCQQENAARFYHRTPAMLIASLYNTRRYAANATPQYVGIVNYQRICSVRKHHRPWRQVVYMPDLGSVGNWRHECNDSAMPSKHLVITQVAPISAVSAMAIESPAGREGAA
ncbi:hypothetical protein FKP32DRAFT_1064993 [Trametes sanguinea]|nr:hypothetical protein FKP32DRAFT_1064993 [Trametes sanguinea]